VRSVVNQAAQNFKNKFWAAAFILIVALCYPFYFVNQHSPMDISRLSIIVKIITDEKNRYLIIDPVITKPLSALGSRGHVDSCFD
jgi:hypothetical protein